MTGIAGWARKGPRLHLVDDEGGRAPDQVVERAGPPVVLLGVPVDRAWPPARRRPASRPRAGRARRRAPGPRGPRRGPRDRSWAAGTRSRNARRSWQSRCPVRRRRRRAVRTCPRRRRTGARRWPGRFRRTTRPGRRPGSRPTGPASRPSRRARASVWCPPPQLSIDRCRGAGSARRGPWPEPRT